ncbi:MAG: helix-turn-helix domain-containing protein [Pseudorhodobacter sp.]
MIGRRKEPSTSEEDMKPKGFDDYDLRLGDLMRGERATMGKSLLDVQRELKIKATYIAAIENCDISAFETQGFVAGYVRSYARYLGMEPDWAFEKFSREANFTLAHGMAAAASPAKMAKAKARARAAEIREPLADPHATFVPRGETVFSGIEPTAVGSLLILVALIGAIGYGGWSVLQEVQRVQLAPVDQAPQVVADIDPLGNVQETAVPLVRSAPAAPQPPEPGEPRLAANTAPRGGDMMDRLYRPQALDVPILTSRDGPISAIDPRQEEQRLALETAEGNNTLAEAIEAEVQVVAADAPELEIFAVRPAWVRVRSADGTVLFEKNLDAGERYSVPAMENPPVLRAGNSGSVYFAIRGQTYGPAKPGAQVAKNVVLSPDSLMENYALADIDGDVDLARYVNVAEVAEP